jgi:hypothetical protein
VEGWAVKLQSQAKSPVKTACCLWSFTGAFPRH